MSAVKAAQWMLGRVQKHGMLDQDVAAYHIKANYGDQYVYINDNGNLAIATAVLKEFRKLTGDEYVWEHGSRMWRRRQSFDIPDRQQD